MPDAKGVLLHQTSAILRPLIGQQRQKGNPVSLGQRKHLDWLGCDQQTVKGLRNQQEAHVLIARLQQQPLGPEHKLIARRHGIYREGMTKAQLLASLRSRGGTEA